MQDAWAKLRKDERGQPTHWRSLGDHSLDVALTLRRLLDVRTIRHRLARLGGLKQLAPSQRDKLAVLAGFHDLGKANRGFQNKGLDRQPQAGHLGEILGLVSDPHNDVAQALLQALNLEALLHWFEGDGETAWLEALHALYSHHGRPVAPPDDFRASLWRGQDQYEPISVVRAVVSRILTFFPDAHQADPLPANPPFFNGFLGLLTLADWIGSDERFFPLYDVDAPSSSWSELERDRAVRTALDRIGLYPQTSPGASRPLNAQDFAAIFGFPPNIAQQRFLDLDLPAPDGSVTVMEAQTGSGKTEAALAWFLRLYRAGLVDGLYFALPTRAAASQIHRRVVEFARRALAGHEVVLAVPGYTPPPASETPGIESDGRRYAEISVEQDRSWAAEHPKRYLAGRVVVGTVDQVLLSGLRVKHAHMRASALLRHLLVVDEVHASDAYMSRVLESVLVRHRASGGHALLLSATLAEATRRRLLAPGQDQPLDRPDEATARPYPAVWCGEPQPEAFGLPEEAGKAKRVEIALAEDALNPERIADLAIKAASRGARVGVLRNTVSGAVDAQRALEVASGKECLFCCAGLPAPHHSRFAREDRITLDQAVEQRLRQDGGLVIVATQTIEQSLDIDFDLLITDLCPIDVFLQRVGRLHRHARLRPEGFRAPCAVVLTPEAPLASFLRARGDAAGPCGIGTVYRDLLILEGTRRILERQAPIDIPADSRRCIEQVLHPDQLRKLAEDLGAPWQDHWSQAWGRDFAQQSSARLNVLDWNLRISDMRFDAQADIATRLGTNSRRIELPSGTCGVFAREISELNVPGWMAEGISELPEVKIQPGGEGGMRIWIDHRHYIYDRLGLRSKEDAHGGRS